MPALVSTQRLGWANGRLELARTIAYALGPALAGIMIARLEAAPAFVVTARVVALLPRRIASIHWVIDAGDECRVIGAQKRDHIGNVLSVAQPADRVQIDQVGVTRRFR